MSVPTYIKDQYPSARQYKSQSFYTVQIGSNCLYISYNVPIAAAIDGQLFVTDTKYSVTTSKHLNLAKGMEPDALIITATPDYLIEASLPFRGV